MDICYYIIYGGIYNLAEGFNAISLIFSFFSSSSIFGLSILNWIVIVLLLSIFAFIIRGNR